VRILAKQCSSEALSKFNLITLFFLLHPFLTFFVSFSHAHNQVFSVCFSNDSRHLVSGSRDKTIRVWDVCTGQIVYVIRDHVDHVKVCQITARKFEFDEEKE
jgi:WD40 repeat protein